MKMKMVMDMSGGGGEMSVFHLIILLEYPCQRKGLRSGR